MAPPARVTRGSTSLLALAEKDVDGRVKPGQGAIRYERILLSVPVKPGTHRAGMRG
jgi:hypothetical protein